VTRPDLRWAGPLAAASGILPTAAILEGEEALRDGRGAWCCPLCGGLNNATPTHGREQSAAGWCQHDRCVTRRDLIREFAIGTPPLPEIVFPAATFDRRAEVFA